MGLLKEKKYYDGFAEYWDKQFTSKAGRNFRDRKLCFLDDCLKDMSGTCLDVGCATGHFTSRIDNPDLTVVGVDMSSGMIAYARNKYPEHRFVVCPVDKLSTKFSGVDCVFMMGLITMESANVVLGECYKTLRSGGKLVIVTGNGYNFYLRFIHDLLSPDLPARVSRLRELELLLNKNGFRVIRTSVFHLVPFRVPDFLFGVAKFIESKVEKTFLVSSLGTIVGVEAVKV